MNKFTLLVSFSLFGALAGCSNESNPYYVESYDQTSSPASVYCVQQGGKLQAFTEDNHRVMYCVLSDDKKYEEWEYYNSRKDSSEK